jgi:pimeloyl-ACP methyl ester carboxylesterase
MMDSLEGKTPERRDVDVDDAAFVIGWNDSASGPLAAQLRAEAARPARTYLRFGEYGSWWLFRCTFWTAPHPVLPIPETITASPVLVIATEADPATPYYGGVALARALGPSANLLTVSGGGHTALERSPCVAQQVTLYLVEIRVPGGHAC